MRILRRVDLHRRLSLVLDQRGVNRKLVRVAECLLRPLLREHVGDAARCRLCGQISAERPLWVGASRDVDRCGSLTPVELLIVLEDVGERLGRACLLLLLAA